MEWWLILLIIFSGLIVLMAIGLPVAFSFILVNIIGVLLLWGGMKGLSQLIVSMESSVSTFTILPVPLFVLIGELLFRSGIGYKAMDVLDKWMGRMPGRLSILAVVAGTLFATLSGMSMASAAMLSSTLVPEMERRGYKKSMSLGPVLGSGGLAIMIPPSSLGVILAWLGEFSVGKFLIAIIVPGILMALFYATYILIRCWLQPSVAPSYKVAPSRLSEKLSGTVRYVLPLFIIVFLVTGVIFLGIATPTEAAATGAFGAFLVAIVYRPNWKILKESFIGAAAIAGMVLFIITGSTAFSQILSFSGAIRELTQAVLALPVSPYILLICMYLIVLVLGCLMDQLSIMMITIPLYMPVILALGYNPIWFGAIYLLCMEIATTSPPFGMTLFVVKSMATPDTTMGDLYRAALPFIGCDLIVLTLILVFPSTTLWLPSLM